MEQSEIIQRSTLSNNVHNSDNDKSYHLQKPSNHLALAIFTTVCCCLPFGIFALIKANSVNKLYRNSEYRYAYLASNDAKKLCIHGIILGLVITGINGSGIKFMNVLFSKLLEVLTLP